MEFNRNKMKRGSRKVSAKRMQREDGVIESELLKSQIAILSGGTDLVGNPVITFPIRSISESKKWDLDDVCKYLVYLQDVVFLIMKRKSAAFLANFRNGCSEETISDIVRALEHLEHERRGAVATFYVIKPKSRSKTRLLKKMLGLKPPKKDSVSFINQFKTVILKTASDVYTQIEQKELTADYGGNLVYDHDTWIYLHKRILPTLAQSEDVKDRLHDVKDKALLMAEYETIGQTADILKTLHVELEDQFNSLIRHSDIELTIEKCKQTLHHLDDPDDDSPILKVHTTLLSQIITQIRSSYKDLTSSQIELDAIWKSVDEGIRKQISLKEKKEEADKLCMEITERFWPLMTQHPNIGTNLNQAELYRNHFKTLLYDPAKEIIADATGILETLQRMDVRDTSQHDGIKLIVERLTNTIHPFASQLNEINQIYVEMHVFFLVFEKALQWYKKALDAIPTSLCSRAANGDSNILNMPPGWRTSVQTFMRKHPAPRDDHIAHIDVNIPDIVDRTTVNQAQLLADRLRLVISVLRSSRLDANLLCHIYDWKIEKMSNTGELLLSDGEDEYHDSVNCLPGRKFSRKNSPPKRRVGRVYNHFNRPRNRREGGSVMESRSPRHHEMLRRTSSADADKHICNKSENPLQKSKYNSEFSLNNMNQHCYNNNDLDNVVEFIQKLTSSRSMSSDKKLQYVSELILNLELDDNSIQQPPKMSRRRYSPSAKIIRKVSRKSSSSDKKPSEEISELNRRLCRSLDNILDLNLNDNKSTYDSLDQSKSLYHLPNSHHFLKPLLKRDDDISVVPETNELSSRESIDSTVTDGGSSRVITEEKEHINLQTYELKNGNNSQDQQYTNLGVAGASKSFIIFNEHSRERSIDCTPKEDSNTTDSVHDKNTDTTDNERTKENFKRRSVTRIASIYKKRGSWNAANKYNGPDSGINEKRSPVIADNELDPLDQSNSKKIRKKVSSSDIQQNVSFDEMDFSNGIFGSAPRKSMLSLSTDLGYDSQHDHTHADEQFAKTTLTRTTSGGLQKERRHSITCGTSVLRLRRTSSNELDGQMTSHVPHRNGHFKEYKV